MISITILLFFIYTNTDVCQTVAIGRIQCNDRHMEVFIEQSFIRGLHKRYVILTHTSCVHVVTLQRLKVTIPLHACGTAKNNVGGGVLYENTLMTSKRLQDKRKKPIAIVSCFYKQKDDVSTTAHNSSYRISMFSSHSMVKSTRPSSTVKVSLQTDDWRFHLSINTCITMPTKSAFPPIDFSTEKYRFHNKRLAYRSSVTTGMSLTEKYFSIKYLVYLDKSRISCNVIIHDVINPYPGRRRRKRDTAVPDVHTDSINMHSPDKDFVQTPSRELVQKRIKKSEHSKNNMKHNPRKNKTQVGPETTKAVMAAGFALLGVVLVMTTVALTIIFKSDEEENSQKIDSESLERLLDEGDD